MLRIVPLSENGGLTYSILIFKKGFQISCSFSFAMPVTFLVALISQH